MSKHSRNITDGIRTLVRKDQELMSGVVVAGSVDETEYTCSVLLTDQDEADVPLEGVMLSAVSENDNGVILIPADESNVIVGSIDGAGQYFIARCSNVTKVMIGEDVMIMINGGNNGGLTITPKLVQQINTIENDLNTLKTAFKNWVVSPNDGGAALKAISGTWFGKQITTTKQSDIENTKIKQ